MYLLLHEKALEEYKIKIGFLVIRSPVLELATKLHTSEKTHAPRHLGKANLKYTPSFGISSDKAIFISSNQVLESTKL